MVLKGGDIRLGPTRLLKLECVVGENTGEASVESQVTLHQRAKTIADIHARLVNLSADVVDGQVMVQGILHKQVFFVGDDDRIHHQAEDVPFCVFIAVPGAAPGMNAHVQGSIAKISHTLHGTHELQQRAILQFFVKVTNEGQFNVAVAPPGVPACLVKGEAVIGETVVACPVENITTLDRPAIKIRDVRVAVEGVVAEVTEGQVIFQGLLTKHVFFISSDNQEFFHEERVPFQGIAEVPGACPGQNVQVHANILRVDRFLIHGTQVRQRVILQVFIKVTETVDVCVALDGTGPLVLAQCIVASGVRQTLVENTLDLDLPAQKIQEITARVTDLTAEVIPNKVIVQGTLHKQIFFVGPDDVVHHQGEDVAFSTFIDLPGAQPWMHAQVVPRVEHVGWHLECECEDDCDDEPEDELEAALAQLGLVSHERVAGLFTRLVQKAVIEICVRVSEDQQVRVRAFPVVAPVVAPC